MEYKVVKAILHILDTNGPLPVYSQEELNFSEEAISDFIIMHVKKIYNDDTSKMGKFNENSFLLSQLININDYFIENSIVIANYLYNIMKQNSKIPSADLLVALISINNISHIAIIKLNYKKGYTHYE